MLDPELTCSFFWMRPLRYSGHFFFFKASFFDGAFFLLSRGSSSPPLAAGRVGFLVPFDRFSLIPLSRPQLFSLPHRAPLEGHLFIFLMPSSLFPFRTALFSVDGKSRELLPGSSFPDSVLFQCSPFHDFDLCRNIFRCHFPDLSSLTSLRRVLVPCPPLQVLG